MSNEKAIDVLNNLVEINNDRIEGYKRAADETDESDLKALFSQFRQTSQQCKDELANEVRRLGGTPVESTRTSGKFYRAWMDIKAALTGKDRKTILNSCEFGEDVAVDTYHLTLKDHTQDISAEQQAMINEQYRLIKADHDKVRNMRDMVTS